jgi:hypothetical protein
MHNAAVIHRNITLYLFWEFLEKQCKSDTADPRYRRLCDVLGSARGQRSFSTCSLGLCGIDIYTYIHISGRQKRAVYHY